MEPTVADITRADAAAVISAQKATDVIQPALESSVVLSTFPTVPMSKKTYSTPFLSALPTAGFVTESATDAAGVKPTTDITFNDRQMVAEEIAVIVPVHENVLDDADIDLWGIVQPLIAQEFGRILDLAVLLGTNAPASWVDANVVGKAIAAGNTVTRGSTRDLAEDFNQTLARLEEDGYEATDVFAVTALKSALRGLRDTAGSPIYLDNLRSDGAASSLLGADLRYLNRLVRAGIPAAASAGSFEAVAVDRTQYQVGIREDINVTFSNQATVGGINLFERDMVAMRVKFRVAFGSRVSPLLGGYPASVLRPVGAV